MPDDTRPTLDHAFLEYVWRLLIRDREIRVGENDEFQHITLTEATTGFPQGSLSTAVAPGKTTGALATPSDGVSKRSAVSLECNVDERTCEDGTNRHHPDMPAMPPGSTNVSQAIDDLPSTLLHEPLSAHDRPASGTRADRPEVRLYTSESRMWWAIAGHGPDLTRVPGLEFVCLSMIAACGPKGIFQADLVRASGQDKRSLPMRTDRLHQGGYIIKRPLSIVQNEVIVHTSLLTLKRFAESSELMAMELTDAVKQKQEGQRTRKKRAVADAAASLPGQGNGDQEAFSPERNQGEDGSSLLDPLLTKPIAQWTLDRNMLNQIYDVVHKSGIEMEQV